MFPRSSIAVKVSALALGLAVALVLPPLVLSREARAQQAQIGPVSKLPLPRFVSLKSDRVNLHEGPSKEHRTLWVYERAGLPVEITAEFEIWRKIRDLRGRRGMGAAFAAVGPAHRPRRALEEGAAAAHRQRSHDSPSPSSRPASSRRCAAAMENGAGSPEPASTAI